MLEKVPAVARSVQIGKTSSATNATVRCVAAKAGGEAAPAHAPWPRQGHSLKPLPPVRPARGPLSAIIHEPRTTNERNDQTFFAWFAI